MSTLSSPRLNRRRFLQVSGYASLAAYLAACGSTPSPTVSAPSGSPKGSSTASGSPAQSAAAEGLQLGPLGGPTLITDPSQWPTTFKESPDLTALVQAGTLPPVEQRVPQEPIVLKPLESTGTYGGTIRKGFNGPGDIQNAARFCTGPDSLMFWDYEWKTLQPWLARDFKVSDDAKTLTITLRKGMKWSDGQPVTADDVLFWYQDVYGNQDLFGPAVQPLTINNKPITIAKVDDLTFTLNSPEANPLLPQAMTAHLAVTSTLFYQGQNAGGLLLPRHYLMNYLPKYAGQDTLDKAAKAAKFEDWTTYYLNQADATLNADLPVLTPWKVKKGNEINTSSWIMERNPYSPYVDTEGNQLPYIDSISWTLAGNGEVVNLHAIAGDYDFQDRYMDSLKLQSFVDPSNQQKGNFKIGFSPGSACDLGLRINLSYDKDAEIGPLISMTDFRRALSMGIDRDQFNQAFFLGIGKPGSYAPPSDQNQYYPGEDARQKWHTLDIDQANTLLDGLGYATKDGAAVRQRKDGKGKLTLDYLCVSQSYADWASMGEMLKGQWAKIGIDLNVRALGSDQYANELTTGTNMFVGFSSGSDELFLSADLAFPIVAGWGTGDKFAAWFNDPGNKNAVEPPQEIKDLMDLWRKGYTAADADRIVIGKQWWAKASDICLQIGIVGGALSQYGFYVAKQNLMNVPQQVINSSTVLGSPRQAAPQTFYYKS